MTTPVDQASFGELVTRFNALLDRWTDQNRSGGSLDTAGVAALPVAADADLDASLRMLGTRKDGSPARIGFPQIMRRVTDLDEITNGVIGTELLPALTATGLPRKIAVNELIRKFGGGIIDVTSPKYNVTPDGRFYAGLLTAKGSAVVRAQDDVFYAGDVGLPIRIAYVGELYSYSCYIGTITGFTNSRQVTVDPPIPGDSGGAVTGMWGTDNTAGMTQALLDARAPDATRRGGVVLMPPGIIITGQLRLGQGIALKGWGRDQTKLLHLRKVGDLDTFLGNQGADVEPVYNGRRYAPSNQYLSDFSINGAKDLAPGGAPESSCYQHGISTYSTDPAVPLGSLTGDPLHYVVNLLCENAQGHGYVMIGRHSGTIIGLDCVSNNQVGMLNASFDVNILNVLCIANQGPGYASGIPALAINSPNSNLVASAGCNVQNLKVSYNGSGGWAQAGFANDSIGQYIYSSNFVEFGGSNVYTAMRVQESMGPNILLFGNNVSGASKNKYAALVIDDTADQQYPADCVPPINPNQQRGGTTALASRPAIMLLGEHVKDNYFFDVTFGSEVRTRDFASHGVFLGRTGFYPDGSGTPGPSRNLIRGWKVNKDDSPSYYNPDLPDPADRRHPRAVSSFDDADIAANSISIDGTTYTQMAPA